jgi:putative DNA primase/helicase
MTKPSLHAQAAAIDVAVRYAGRSGESDMLVRGLKAARRTLFKLQSWRDRLSEDADVLEGLHIAEGLETALDVMAEGFRPCWSTGSTAIMAKFPVLSGIEALTIIADHDLNGAGLRAASEAADRWQTAGRETHVFQRETPGDFNDAFREIER